MRIKGLLFVFALPALAASSGDNLMFNGSFELGAFVDNGNGAMSLAPGSTAILGWTTHTGELVWLTTPNSYSTSASDESRFLDLTGYHDSSPYGGVVQTITTVAGHHYKLIFDLGNNSIYGVDASVTASAGSTSASYTLHDTTQTMVWKTLTLDFVATGSLTAISFVGASPSGNAIGLDHVEVLESAVPEPASILALGGAAAFAIRRRKRR
jgi:hypothetical protein